VEKTKIFGNMILLRINGQVADFPGSARETAIGFSIGNKGYVGLGTDATYSDKNKDFWQYDPSTNTWIKKADYPGTGIYGATGFSVNDKGYVGLGGSAEYGQKKDFWE
jgi:N-acetylneuraminic acid mutarotase